MNLILSESRRLRFFTFTMLYLAQGFPFGLVNTALPAYLAERGESAVAIASFIVALALRLVPREVMHKVKRKMSGAKR